MTAHKGTNYTKLTASRWTPQNVRENSASVRHICDDFTGAPASGDTLKLVGPPAYANVDPLDTVIFVSGLSPAAVIDIGSDSGTGTAATCLFSEIAGPGADGDGLTHLRTLRLEGPDFVNLEWDGGALQIGFAGSYTTATIVVTSQMAYKDVP